MAHEIGKLALANGTMGLDTLLAKANRGQAR